MECLVLLFYIHACFLTRTKLAYTLILYNLGPSADFSESSDACRKFLEHVMHCAAIFEMTVFDLCVDMFSYEKYVSRCSLFYI